MPASTGSAWKPATAARPERTTSRGRLGGRAGGRSPAPPRPLRAQWFVPPARLRFSPAGRARAPQRHLAGVPCAAGSGVSGGGCISPLAGSAIPRASPWTLKTRTDPGDSVPHLLRVKGSSISAPRLRDFAREMDTSCPRGAASRLTENRPSAPELPWVCRTGWSPSPSPFLLLAVPRPPRRFSTLISIVLLASTWGTAGGRAPGELSPRPGCTASCPRGDKSPFFLL